MNVLINVSSQTESVEKEEPSSEFDATVSGPSAEKRLDWMFKRRQIEYMTLGHSRQTCQLNLGAVIGIGIYVRSAQALFLGGPIAMILGYIWVGSVAYAVIVHRKRSRKLIQRCLSER